MFFVCSGLFVCGCVGLVVALFVLGFVCYLGGLFLFVLGFLFLFGVCLVAGWLFGFFLVGWVGRWCFTDSILTTRSSLQTSPDLMLFSWTVLHESITPIVKCCGFQ